MCPVTTSVPVIVAPVQGSGSEKGWVPWNCCVVGVLASAYAVPPARTEPRRTPAVANLAMVDVFMSASFLRLGRCRAIADPGPPGRWNRVLQTVTARHSPTTGADCSSGQGRTPRRPGGIPGRLVCAYPAAAPACAVTLGTW